jgi:CBS domain-containing protein
MSIEIKKNITVENVMLDIDSFPIVNDDTIIKEALEKMLFYKLGVVCVVDNKMNFLGLITDGDIRRILLKVQKPLSALFMEDVMDHISIDPVAISPDMLVSEATKLIGKKRVWDLPVLSNKKKILGLFHLHKALEFYLQND